MCFARRCVAAIRHGNTERVTRLSPSTAATAAVPLRPVTRWISPPPFCDRGITEGATIVSIALGSVRSERNPGATESPVGSTQIRRQVGG
jgi:hypothetical protein